MLFVAAVASFIVGAVRAPDVVHFVIVTCIAVLAVSVFGLVFGYLYRKNVIELGGKLARALICIAVVCGVVAFVLLGGVVPLLPMGALSVALWAAAFVNMIFNMMRTRETPEALALRRQLGAARLYFERELQSATPQLEDAWYPYLLAFGLGPNIDRWFKAFGGDRNPGRIGSRTGGASIGGSRSTSGSTWTGGGGAFGGAGASGTWAAAVGSIASGVAKPSSGGGRSSGGGSSRSSGGGGGGGW